MEFKNHNLEYGESMFNDVGDSDNCAADDDAFYIELRRQILLLTADDEDENFHQAKISNSVRDWRQGGSSRLTSSTTCAFQRGSYFHWWEGENTNSAPTWLLNLWKRTGNGTGVFIPQMAKSRRRCRPAGRTNIEKSRMYRAKKQT